MREAARTKEAGGSSYKTRAAARPEAGQPSNVDTAAPSRSQAHLSPPFPSPSSHLLRGVAHGRD